jgi:hypothetical protein
MGLEFKGFTAEPQRKTKGGKRNVRKGMKLKKQKPVSREKTGF